MIRLTFLGTGAAIPSVERGVSALMVQRAGRSLLFDCGEGTQRQMMRYGVGFTVDDIFFTHFHADHTLGLPGLLRTFGMQDRTAPLRLYGPRGAQQHLGTLVRLGMERPKFPVEIIELSPGEPIPIDDFNVMTGLADHRGAALCFALVESERLGRFDPELARTLGVPEGPAWGQIHRGQPVTLPDGTVVTPKQLVGPSRPGRRIVISGDTVPAPAVRELATGADCLVHEATFSDLELDRALETRHSTARQAAEVARDAGVGQLLLTHISARYSREAPELTAEARVIFPDTRVARDGMIVEVAHRDEVAGQSGDPERSGGL